MSVTSACRRVLDKLKLLQGAAGALVWLGRRRPWQRLTADAGVPPKASDGGAVGRQGSLEGTGEWARVVRVSAGEQGPGAGRGEGGSATRRLGARACKTCALGAPRARTGRARRNANACHRAWVRLAISRPRLGVARILVDKVAGLVD